MKFRDYQEYAINSIFQYFQDGGTGNPIVVMPTGTGKSLVIGGFIKRALTSYPGQRIIKLTHVKELIEQNFEKLLALWPTAPAGIYSAGLNRRDLNTPILYAGIASIIKVAKELGHVDLMLIDECHLVSNKDNSMYMKVIETLREINPNIKIIGFTATHYRTGTGMLTEGDGIFTDVCVDMTDVTTFNWFFNEGYLSRLIPRSTTTRLSTEGVSAQQGDYNLKELQKAVDRDEVTYAALKEALELGYTRKRWLVFASGVDHAIHIAEMLESLGVSATCIHSKLTNEERNRRTADHRAGLYTAMVNNGILTTGYDDPAIDLIIMLRPTQSAGLWVQMLGRGTRPLYAPGYDLSTREGRLAAIANGDKKDCLVLDFANNTSRLGPINDPVIPKKRIKGTRPQQAPVRVCDNCNVYCHASLRLCPNCGFEFPRMVKFGTLAGTSALIKDGAEDLPIVETFKVDRVVYLEHRKTGKPPSMRVSYYCGLRKFDEWVCLEHTGYSKVRARNWWRERASGASAPDTILEAFTRLEELQTPCKIKVWINKKNPEILGYEYNQDSTRPNEPTDQNG